VAKKLHKQKIIVNEFAVEFENYFFSNISRSVYLFIKDLQQECDLFLFSGIIRDYFLESKNSYRDIDLIYLSKNFDIDAFLILKNYTFKKNSFGGYKISIDGIDIDLWNIQNTWGIKKFESRPFYEWIYELIPQTSFFNFSSVIYSFSNREFIYTEQFENFVNNKKIDIVLSENPNPVLCIINIFYYQQKLNLDLAKRTIEYFLENFEKYSSDDYRQVQEKHFGKQIISYSVLSKYFSKYQEKVYLKIIKQK